MTTTYTHSDARLKFYYEVCARKQITPLNVMEIAPVALGKEIERILELPAPASDKQKEMIREIIAELVSIGVEGIKMPSQKFFDSLTGGRDGSASQWIERLQKKRTENFDKLPITEQQLERLVEWYACPDIPFEEFGVSMRIYEEHLQVYSTDLHTPDVLEKRMWRRATPLEFRDQLTRRLTHSTASRLIDQYSGVFSVWMRDRASDSQKKQIRRLEERLSTVYVPKEVTLYDLEDNGGDNPFGANGSSKKHANWNPISYVGMDEVQIGLLSRDEANKHINRLRYELQAKELYNTSDAQSLSGDFEDMRTAKNEASARTKEFTELNNMMYALSDVVGNHFELSYPTDDGEVTTVASLRQDAMRVFFNGGSEEAKADVRGQIVDFMKDGLVRNCITFKQLIEMCDKSNTAMEILDALTDDMEFSRILMKKQLQDK